MKGKPWTREEIEKLKQLVKAGENLKEIAETLKKSEDAVYHKIKRLELRKEEGANRGRTPSSTGPLLPGNLLTHKQVCEILAAAIKALHQPNQDKEELMRFNILVKTAQTYDSLLEKFERWSEIENRLFEMDKKIAEIQKGKKLPS